MENPVSPPRVSSPPSKWWKLCFLADVAAAVSDYEKEEERIFVNVPRKKRSRRSSSTTRVMEKQRSDTGTEESCEEEEAETSLKKRKLVCRFDLGSSSSSRSINEERELIQNPSLTSGSSPLSSVVNESKKRRNFFKEDEEEVSLKKRRIVQTTTVPEWLVNVMMREEINGYDPKLMLEKKLYKSDVEKVQSRLSMPSKQVVSSDFLSEEESRIIYEQSVLKNRKEGLSVVLVDPLLKKHVVDLRKWKMSGNWNYVFVDGWNDVVSTNSFQVGEVYHVWSFRSAGGKLCFALVPPPARSSSDSCHGGSSSSLSSL